MQTTFERFQDAPAPRPSAPRSLEVRVATTDAERLAAKRLRFDVFNRELSLGLDSSYASGIDEDAHDAYCDHLIVVDRERDAVVGTYRLLPWNRVPSFGFYSETEFDLHNVRRSGMRLLELGRSCIAPEYRDGRTIHLLFKGIAEYATTSGAEAMMGCASIHGNDVDFLSKVWGFLGTKHLSPPNLRVMPRAGYEMSGFDVPFIAPGSEVLAALPPLFKGYLRLGALVCGPPAYDRPFGTTDFFILAPLSNVASLYGRRFLSVG